MESKKIKALITGGAGFIGSHLVDFLLEKNWDVTIVDNLSSGNLENVNKKAKFHKMCLIDTDYNSLLSVFKNIDYVFHMAASASIPESIEDPLKYNKLNVDSTIRCLNLAKDANIKKLIFSASSSVYGDAKELPTTELCPVDPLSPYALQKLIGEQYCKLFSKIYGLNTVSLRYFNVYGERMSLKGAYKLVIPIWEDQFKNNHPLTVVNDGTQRRDFVYVKDVAYANYCAAISKKNNGEVYNVGTGNNISINEMIEVFDCKSIHIGKRIEPQVMLCNPSLANKELNWYHKTEFKLWLKEFVKKMKLIA